MARKPTITEEQVEEIIGIFKKEKKIMGNIEYLEVYRFNKELYNAGRVSVIMGNDFWRKKGRLGRKKIDEANEVYRHKLDTFEEEHIVFRSIVTDVINKSKGDSKKLLEELLPIEKDLFNSIRRENKLKKDNQLLTNQLEQLKEKNNLLINQVSKLEEIIFNIFRYSSYTNIPIVNFLETGEKESEIVKSALDEMFEKPMDFISWFNKKTLEKESNSRDNIVEIDKNKRKEGISERIKNRYKR